MLEREIEVWQGLLGIGLAAAQTAVAVSLIGSIWYFPALLSIVGVFGIWHLLCTAASRRGEREMLEEDQRRCQRAIEFDHRNAAAHAFLAAVCRKQGRREEAAAEYEIAIGLDPRDTKTRHELKSLLREMQGLETAKRCPRCEGALDASGKTCPQCGWSCSTLKGLRDVWAGGAVKQGLLYGILVSTAVGVVGAVLRLSFEFTFGLLLGLWIVGLVLFLRWVLREGA